MNFFIEWIIFYVGIMFCMSVDNIFWIPTSPEYDQFKRGYGIQVEGKIYNSRIAYIIKYRIWSVLTHWRDIIPAIMTSLILTIVL